MQLCIRSRKRRTMSNCATSSRRWKEASKRVSACVQTIVLQRDLLQWYSPLGFFAVQHAQSCKRPVAVNRLPRVSTVVSPNRYKAPVYILAAATGLEKSRAPSYALLARRS